MANTKLTIQHKSNVFEPPVEDGVKIEWERTGSPGKLTFTAIEPPNEKLNFVEGDVVRFYCDDKCVFSGYVFKKKRDKEQKIEVTCYDQMRYLKNKYTYVFEKKTATQIIQALCKDFSLSIGTFDNTNYVIPAIAEENISALDIILDVLGETITNTGNMFVFYDDAGTLQLKNAANMKSQTLIFEESAENFDYTSSIDDETYNHVVLYYKSDDKQIQIYTASSPSRIKEWGLLRYFEETDVQTAGQNKANALLKLFNKKTRELKVTGAFGDISVRGGTLIPVKLDLGDVTANNYMLVDKVTHLFENGIHTMDLTLEGEWEDNETTDMVSQTIGEIIESTTPTEPTTPPVVEVQVEYVTLKFEYSNSVPTIRVSYTSMYPEPKSVTLEDVGRKTLSIPKNAMVTVEVTQWELNGELKSVTFEGSLPSDLPEHTRSNLMAGETALFSLTDKCTINLVYPPITGAMLEDHLGWESGSTDTSTINSNPVGSWLDPLLNVKQR